MKKKNYQAGSVIGALLVILAWVLFIGGFAYGWVSNIITIANDSFANVTGMLILRIIGIFMAPLGAVLGYF